MDWQEELSNIFNNCSGARIKLNELLSAHTSFRIGGPADVFAQIRNMEQLKKLTSFCRSRSIPLLVIGRGTNLLVNDEGYRGVVVKLCGDFDKFEFPPLKKGGEGGFLVAGAAFALSRLSRLTAQKGLSGLEFAFGIPGSLGGALIMNAGAGPNSIGEIVDAVEVIAQDLTPELLNKNELKFAYRWSNLNEYICVTKIHLNLKPGSPEETMECMNRIFQKKKVEQPLSAASAGCVFKNPASGISAGKLIDECGLKGTRIGGAQVSAQHANFIINTGGAVATDVLNLIDRIRSTVKERTGIYLELELRVV